MPAVDLFQSNFNSGELSPKLAGHIDFDRYVNGARTIKNFIVMPQGGVTRRPGSVYGAAVKDQTKFTRMIPFIFTQGDAYALECGENYFRFFQNNAQVTSGGPPLEVASTYAEADLAAIKYAQIGDILYLVHTSYKPRKLVRTGATTWTLSDVDWYDGPYLAANGTVTTLQPNGTSGTVTITASSTTGINDDAGFQSTDVGRLVRIKNGASWGYAKITVFTDTTHVDAVVQENFPAATATTTWALGAWSDTTGWPGAIAFHQQRLFLAGTANDPQTVWGSQSADYENMRPDDGATAVAADDAVTYALATSQVNIIRWLGPGKALFAGGNGEAVAIFGGDTNGAITATSVPDIRPAATFGSDATASPVRVGDDLIWVQRGARKVRSMRFLFETDGFSTPDLTLLADHITQGGIAEMAYADQPNSVLWCVKDTGELCSLTYNRDEKVAAWHRHITGGNFGGNDAEIESLCVIPSADYDQVWWIAKRTIDGATTRYVEYLSEPYEDGLTAQEDAVQVDSAVIYDGAAITTLTGLDHLEGEEVQVLVDGANHPPQTVAGGQITLESSASVVVAGLSVQSDLEPQRLTVARRQNGIQGFPKKITHVIARLLATGEFYYGEDEDSLFEAVFRDADVPGNQAVPLYTGDQVLAWEGQHGTDRPALFRATGPQPCTLLGLGFHAEIGDRP